MLVSRAAFPVFPSFFSGVISLSSWTSVALSVSLSSCCKSGVVGFECDVSLSSPVVELV